jgi:uncharacterized membrane protein
METFTDGVFAIAATLLVLEISIDSAHTHNLGSFLPSPTRLVADYLQRPGEQTAVYAYAATFVVMAVVYNVWWRYASTGRRLISPDIPESRVLAITRAFNPGVPIYVLTLLVAIVSPLASVFLTFAVAAFYLPSAALFER